MALTPLAGVCGSPPLPAQVTAAAKAAGAPSAAQAQIADVYAARHPSLREAMLEKLSTISKEHLEDFDWSLRVW